MNTTSAVTAHPTFSEEVPALHWRGGDCIVVAALCAALEQVGSKGVAAGGSRAQKSVVAFLEERSSIDAANEAVAEFLADCAGVPADMSLTVTSVEPNYRGEDVGLHWKWVCGGVATSGVYPVNLKDEPGHKPGSVSRVARRYGILKRMTGCKHDTNCDNGAVLAERISNPDQAVLGVGVLAFLGCGPDTKVVAYDPLLLYSMTGDDLRLPSRRGDRLSRVLAEMNLAAELLPGRAVLVYDNEGTLLQSSHLTARALWPTLVRLALSEGLYASTLISWFEARFAGESAELLRSRAVSHERDAVTMRNFL